MNDVAIFFDLVGPLMMLAVLARWAAAQGKDWHPMNDQERLDQAINHIIQAQRLVMALGEDDERYADWEVRLDRLRADMETVYDGLPAVK